ncbi:MAG TPA: hypothetical protein DDY37_00970 [Legionella sp.]|nr:hypothetical protein [Legionella sp.]
MAKRISVEQLIILHNQLEAHPPRNPARTALVQEFAESFGVTPSTVYRQLRQCIDFSSHKRKDFNQPRAISSDDMLMYCRLIAALKIRTSNKNNRHLSTPKCIEILELHGVETAHGLVIAPLGVLKRSTVNRYITQWGFAHHSMLVAQGGCQLSIILAGHPKLGNSLSKSSIEEIGARTKIFNIDTAMGNNVCTRKLK